MIDEITYRLKHPIAGVSTLTLKPPTLRLFVRVGTPYRVERKALDQVGDKTQHTLTADFRRLVAFLVEMSRQPRELIEKIDAEDLSSLLLIVQAMTLHTPEAAGQLYDLLVFSDVVKMDARTVESMTVPEASTIVDRAVKYVARTTNGNR